MGEIHLGVVSILITFKLLYLDGLPKEVSRAYRWRREVV